MSRDNGQNLDITNKIKREVLHQTEDWFSTADVYMRRIKLIGAALLFVAGAGYAASLYVSKLAMKGDLDGVTKKIESMDEKTTQKITAVDDKIERVDEKIERVLGKMEVLEQRTR